MFLRTWPKLDMESLYSPLGLRGEWHFAKPGTIRIHDTILSALNDLGFRSSLTTMEVSIDLKGDVL
jgi:hypothetical protein